MGQCCPVKCTVFPSETHNSLLRWAYKLNSTTATAENWHLKECMLKVKHYTCTMVFKHTFKHLLTAGVRILQKIVSIAFNRNKSSMFLNTVLNTSYVQAFMWGKKVIVLVSQTFESYCTTVCICSDHKYSSEHPLTCIHARQIKMMSIQKGIKFKVHAVIREIFDS